jgi:hypothetical protein
MGEELNKETNVYLDSLKSKFPKERLENEIEKIEKLGYVVSMTDDAFQISKGTKLIIDSDFSTDYYSNAVLGINSFWNKL